MELPVIEGLIYFQEDYTVLEMYIYYYYLGIVKQCSSNCFRFLPLSALFILSSYNIFFLGFFSKRFLPFLDQTFSL